MIQVSLYIQNLYHSSGLTPPPTFLLPHPLTAGKTTNTLRMSVSVLKIYNSAPVYNPPNSTSLLVNYKHAILQNLLKATFKESIMINTSHLKSIIEICTEQWTKYCHHCYKRLYIRDYFNGILPQWTSNWNTLKSATHEWWMLIIVSCAIYSKNTPEAFTMQNSLVITPIATCSWG
jgi:hypothetical protein